MTIIDSINKGFKESLAGVRFALKENERVVDIFEIPKERSQFLNTPNEWREVVYPDCQDKSSCMFWGKAGETFPKHRHQFSSEQILLDKGKIKIFTPKRTLILDASKTPQLAYFEIDEPHVIEFLTDVEFQCIWKPKMHGWHANFEN